MTLEELELRMQGLLEHGWKADLLCAVRDGTVLGYALYQFREHPYHRGRQEVYLRQYYVRREYRGNGLGEEGIRLLKEQRFTTVDTVMIDVLETNPAGMRFWSKVGFAPYCITMKLAVKDE